MWYNIIRGSGIAPRYGGVAQLGERCVRNAEVEGSIPFGSIRQKLPRYSSLGRGISGIFSFSLLHNGQFCDILIVSNYMKGQVRCGKYADL